MRACAGLGASPRRFRDIRAAFGVIDPFSGCGGFPVVMGGPPCQGFSRVDIDRFGRLCRGRY
jgi:site-specific DNA-cytosine methylase